MTRKEFLKAVQHPTALQKKRLLKMTKLMLPIEFEVHLKMNPDTWLQFVILLFEKIIGYNDQEMERLMYAHMLRNRHCIDRLWVKFKENGIVMQSNLSAKNLKNSSK